MKKRSKIAIIALMAIVAVAGTIGGVALAQDEEEVTATTTTEAAPYAFMERVCEIYQEKTGVAIDADTLKDALCQAGNEKMEQARNQFRQRLIDEGILTEEQLNELEEWLQARPDFPTEEYQSWLESRPDIPALFGQGNLNGIGPFGSLDRGFRNHLGNRLPGGLGDQLGGWCQQGNGAE